MLYKIGLGGVKSTIKIRTWGRIKSFCQLLKTSLVLMSTEKNSFEGSSLIILIGSPFSTDQKGHLIVVERMAHL